MDEQTKGDMIINIIIKGARDIDLTVKFEATYIAREVLAFFCQLYTHNRPTYN